MNWKKQTYRSATKNNVKKKFRSKMSNETVQEVSPYSPIEIVSSFIKSRSMSLPLRKWLMGSYLEFKLVACRSQSWNYPHPEKFSKISNGSLIKKFKPNLVSKLTIPSHQGTMLVLCRLSTPMKRVSRPNIETLSIVKASCSNHQVWSTTIWAM